ncbi:MAG: polysaccharide biosynthesis protein [Bacteroidaceae bacterium]
MLSLTDLVEELGIRYTSIVPEIEIRESERICITGAGGTIGSALCRALFNRGVRNFLLIDQSEYNLYKIHQELTSYGAEVVPILASYGDYMAIKDQFLDFKPTTVYHAGAYKHVPLCEINWKAAFTNNVVHASHFFDLCLAAKVQTTVVISSDKAVNPTSFMGATKLLVEYAAIRTLGEDRVKIVRFGNVLGSSGSVVPLFHQQIKQGKKLTVTHEGVTRYFMTVQQASALVINCTGLVGTRFLLNMGKPVRIFDLAMACCQIMGVCFNYEITGLRVGEKMHEQLTHDTKAVPLQEGAIYSIDEMSYPDIQSLIFMLANCHDYDRAKELLTHANIGWCSNTSPTMPTEGYDPNVEDCYKITPAK